MKKILGARLTAPRSSASTPSALALSTVLIALLGAPMTARATGFSDIGDDIAAHEDSDDFSFEVDGYLRVRGEALTNLDLDRGPTPSGELFFPVVLDDPDAQTLFQADMRLRTDIAMYAPGGAVAVKVRLDTLDNLTLGSTPDGAPSAATSQRAVETAIRVRRAYGEVLTPFGLLAAGRMGNTWGLGMLANGGDCPDCDSGDAQDRIAFLTPLADHIFAASFDITGTGPITTRRAGFRAVDVTPTDDVRTATFAFLRHLGDAPRDRRHAAGRTTIEYGAYISHRWQDGDIPAAYAPVSVPVVIDGAQVVPRGFQATVVDGYLRVQGPEFRIEAEAAFLYSRVDQPTLIPGALLRDSVTSTQWGAALQTVFMRPSGPFVFGIDAGVASGDSAPGFGAFPRVGQAAARSGDLDGAQANVPYDTTLDNFRFHPDYRIDRILFREIIGTVTDTFYFRPHARLTLFEAPFGTAQATLFAVSSFAMEPNSAPGGDRPLGIEVDPGLTYTTRDGFYAALDYAVLFPLAGLDNRELGYAAQPAQLLRLRLMYAY